MSFFKEIARAQTEAVSTSIDNTFGDCDEGLRDAIKTSEDPTVAWHILADWLEERGDPRAAWIRSHKLDRLKQFVDALTRAEQSQEVMERDWHSR